MTVNFHPAAPSPENDCPICFEPLSKKVVTHEGYGEKHPIHKKCIKKWVKENASNGIIPTCPICRANIDVEDPFAKKALTPISTDYPKAASCVGHRRAHHVHRAARLKFYVITPYYLPAMHRYHDYNRIWMHRSPHDWFNCHHFRNGRAHHLLRNCNRLRDTPLFFW